MKFSFCIITNGDLSSVNAMIDSIESQNIPDSDYEIIIVGGDEGNLLSRKNILHCCFDETIKPNWITKKKMLAVEHAAFENVVITHDYITFDPGWYEGWLRFNDNDWDVSMNVIYNGDGERFRDWLALDPHAAVPYNITGYYPTMYISGTYWVAKKQFMLNNPLDISRGWCEAEDIEWSMRCRGTWNYKMNKLSSVRSNKFKETWNILDQTGVQSFVHYRHFWRILGEKFNFGITDDNGVLYPNQDQSIRSIHYLDFDLIRNEIRRLSPKNIVVSNDPFGMAAFAASWVANEIGANVTVLDNVGGLRIEAGKLLCSQFGWDKHTFYKTEPNQLTESIDMAILGGTFDEQTKIREINIIKPLLSNEASVFIYNTNSENIRRELPGGEQIGCFYRAVINNGTV